MSEAFQPFEQYIQYLAEGKLDGYLDSTRLEDKIAAPGVLLLHNLGNYQDQDRIKKLFIDDTMFVLHPNCAAVADCAYRFLFNTSGAGKTRLALEGLCHHWGSISHVGANLDFHPALVTLRQRLRHWRP